jgi:hypothetical protein
VQLLQLGGGVDAQLVGQMLTGTAVPLQSSGPAAVEGQRPHQVQDQRFGQRVTVDDGGQPVDHCGVPAGGDLRVGPVGQQSVDLLAGAFPDPGHPLTAQPGQRLTVPQVDGPP